MLQLKSTQELFIPLIWQKLLAEIQVQDPKAIIAGGAIRDLYCGVQFDDLDIFTTSSPQCEGLDSSGFDYEGMQYVLAVGSYQREGIDVNIIVINETEPMQLLESFDFGLCQIGFDGNDIIKTRAFDWDFKYNLMTMRHIDRYQRSIHRYCRISQRLKFEIAIPELETKKAV